MNLMLSRICKFFLTLVSSLEFLELNDKELCTLLKSNSIGRRILSRNSRMIYQKMWQTDR
uniref:BACK domain-containing protein n=1 Tax=Megaselia scalaris TaxID=36166 RepID=T1GJR7_MEGSC